MGIDHIYGLSGIIIIAIFLMCAAYLAYNKDKLSFDGETMSTIASNPKNINWVRLFCWTVAILIFPYILGLMKYFEVDSRSPSILLGVSASVSLFLAGLTLNRAKSFIHIALGAIFFISLFFMPLDIAFGLLGTEYKYVGSFVISLFTVSALIMLWNLIKVRGKADGITEMLVRGLSSTWVILYSILMLINA